MLNTTPFIQFSLFKYFILYIYIQYVGQIKRDGSSTIKFKEISHVIQSSIVAYDNLFASKKYHKYSVYLSFYQTTK